MKRERNKGKKLHNNTHMQWPCKTLQIYNICACPYDPVYANPAQ